MKKCILLSVFLALTSSIFAQSWLWGRQGKGSVEDGWAVAEDTNKNVYQTGVMGAKATYGSYNLTDSNQTMFLVKYDPCGAVLWAKNAQVGSKSDGMGYSLAVDKKNNLIVTGYIIGKTSFGPFNLSSPQGVPVLFLAKYDENGNVIWATQSKMKYTVLGGTFANSVAVDASDNIYVAGQFSDTIEIGIDTLRAYATDSSDPPVYNVFLAKYDQNGNPLWAKQSIINSQSSYGTGAGVAIDTLGNPIITGEFLDTIGFGAYKLISKNLNMFLVKYDPNGNVMWARKSVEPNNSSNASGTCVATNKSGYLYVTGSIEDVVVFGSDTLKSVHGGDAFLVKYDLNGNVVGAYQTNDLDITGCEGEYVATDEAGGIYLSISGGVPIGMSHIIYQNDTFSMLNASDEVLILKLDYSGNLVCGTALPTGGDDQNGIATDPAGNYIYFGSDLGDTVILGPDTLSWSNISEQSYVGRWRPSDRRIISCDSIILSVAPEPVVPDCNDLFIPNAFSPNNDGQNDILLVKGHCIKTIDFVIFDRWGDKVFESENQNEGWNGTYNGKPMNTGTYVWCLKAIMQNGKPIEKNGNVVLVR